MQIQTDIERFLLDDLLAGVRERIEPDEPLFSSGLLDSLGTLRLITFLEERFNLRIGDGEVGDENFGSIARLTAFVRQKQGEAQSPA